MYQELSGSYIEPLAAHEDLVRWRERRDNFRKMVDRVTRDLDAVTRGLTGRSRILPLYRERQEQDPENLPREDYELRYVCQPLGTTESCFSIGVRDPFEGSDTPIWLRFHKATPGFRDIRERIESSALPWRLSDGHIWIPLDVPIGVDGDDVVKALVAQTEGIARIAYPRETWHTP